MADPYANNCSTSNAIFITTTTNGGDSAVPENSAIDETSPLKEVPKKFGRIVIKSKNERVCDVALRLRWLAKKKKGQIKMEDGSSPSVCKHKKVMQKKKGAYQQVETSSYDSQLSTSIDSSDDTDEDIYKEINGAPAQLLEQNEWIMNQMCANFAAFKPFDNTDLVPQMKSNIVELLNEILKDELGPEVKQSAVEILNFPILFNQKKHGCSLA